VRVFSYEMRDGKRGQLSNPIYLIWIYLTFAEGEKSGRIFDFACLCESGITLLLLLLLLVRS
jgi:hypothetical protein